MKWILFSLALASCATTSDQQGTVGKPNYTYRADMQITIGGATFDGMGAYKLTGPVQMILNSPVALDRLQITSCGRQDVFRDAKSPFVYSYAPTPQELDGKCPLYIEAYSKTALTSWGMLAFRSDETLPAHVYFNGVGITFAGFSIGQSKNGLEQVIEFTDPVKMEAETSCGITTPDNKKFTLTPLKGFCRATFARVVARKIQWHRLLFLGYEGVLVRD